MSGFNCIIVGVGGQGTVLASKLLAQAAINKGWHAATAETIGMAQRGGTVVGHLKCGEHIFSPLLALGTADLLIGFEPAETVRALPYLKNGGAIVVNKTPVMPFDPDSKYSGSAELGFLRQQVAKLYIADGDLICQNCGTGKVLNIALLGEAVRAGFLPFSIMDLEVAMEQMLPEKLIAINIKAINGTKNKNIV
ncbi:MAG: 2-oxoacid:acceptor oxidoreductase family protein [Clostridia bacterium]|nr:2-oxoacid:acceptor oxidoreductase family protein [Clostridia bacterium]